MTEVVETMEVEPKTENQVGQEPEEEHKQEEEQSTKEGINKEGVKERPQSFYTEFIVYILAMIALTIYATCVGHSVINEEFHSFHMYALMALVIGYAIVIAQRYEAGVFGTLETLKSVMEMIEDFCLYYGIKNYLWHLLMLFAIVVIYFMLIKVIISYIIIPELAHLFIHIHDILKRC